MASVPKPSDEADWRPRDRAGLGRVLAARDGDRASAIDSGRARLPRLVTGAADDRVKLTRIPADVLTDLRQMMLSVVQSGPRPAPACRRDARQDRHRPVGTGPNLKIDGWLMGYDGDIAFAIVTQDTGGRTAARSTGR